MLALLWIAATYVGAILYAVPVLLVSLMLGLGRLQDPARAGEIGAAMRVVAAVLCGAACGSTIGIAQWLVLRRDVKQVGWWITATVAGYASLGVCALLASALEPKWLDWAVTLIVNGKLFWLARVNPEWSASSWGPGALTLTLFGGVLGACQWLVLRGRVQHAAWWIAINATGWALAAALANVSAWIYFSLYVTLIPMVVTGLGISWLRSSRVTRSIVP